MLRRMFSSLRFLIRYKRKVKTLEDKIAVQRQELTRLLSQAQDRNRTIDELKQVVEAQRERIDLLSLPVQKYIDEINSLAITIEQGTEDSPCLKVKCCTRAEAKEFAFHARRRLNHHFEPYECEKCPVNKRTGELYWHITHKDRKLRGLYGSANVQRNASKAG